MTKAVVRVLFTAYAVFSTLATFYFAHEVRKLKEDHAVLFSHEFKQYDLEHRMTRVERLWGIGGGR